MNLTPDGRTSRWEEHNASRRVELVQCCLRAIRSDGPHLGMDEFATAAGTSKTVLYRHFGDRNGLHHAVAEYTLDFIIRKLPLSQPSTVPPSELVRILADAYLSLVERDPNIYQFVISQPCHAADESVVRVTTRIGNVLSESLANWLRSQGLDEAPANTWSHGVVGFVYAVADRWILTNLSRPREEVVGFICQLFNIAFTPTQRSQR